MLCRIIDTSRTSYNNWKKEKEKWDNSTRTRKYNNNKTMVTRAQEDAESDDFGDEVILVEEIMYNLRS